MLNLYVCMYVPPIISRRRVHLLPNDAYKKDIKPLKIATTIFETVITFYPPLMRFDV